MLLEASNKPKEVEQNLYADLIQELQTDLVDVRSNLDYNNKYLLRYNRASEIILNDPQRLLIDTLAIITTELTNFSDFHNEESAYNKLAASGKLEIITNSIMTLRL